MNQLLDRKFLVTNNIFNQITNRDDSNEFVLVNNREMANLFIGHHSHTFIHCLLGPSEQNLGFHNFSHARAGR